MTALYLVGLNQTAQPTDLNQLVNVLQQPSGGQEKGKYFIANQVNITNGVIGQYMPTLSRNTAPVVSSCSIDESDQTHTGGMGATPVLGQVTANGFQVYTLTSTSGSTNARAGGNYTMQY